jgi:hypothetical protein
MTNNKLVTPVSDKLLQEIRHFLDTQADCAAGGNDPAQRAEPNAAMRLLISLDLETEGEFK